MLSFIPETAQRRSADTKDSQGKLKAFDLRSNLVLADCVEREFSSEEGVEMVPLGLYMIKGDNV